MPFGTAIRLHGRCGKMDRKILITGGTGFVGNTLVPFLVSNGCNNIALLVRDEEKARKMFFGMDLKIISLKDNNWRDAIKNFNPEAVIHLAAFFSTKCDTAVVENLVQSNLMFTAMLLEALQGTDCEYFINTGTFTEFMNGDGKFFPANFYSATKTAERPIIEYFNNLSGRKWVNIILYSPYGRKNSYKKVIDYLADAMDSPVPVAFSKGEQVLDFIHVDDIASFYLALLNRLELMKENFEEFHLGTGKGISIREVAEIIESVFGKRINAEWGALPYRKFDVMRAVAPVKKNIEILGWKSKISMEEGLRIYKADIGR